MTAPPQKQRTAGEGLAVRVTTRARGDEIAGLRDGVLLVRVAAPPVDGLANAAVRALIARRLGVRSSQVTIVGGERSRQKVVRVEGLAAEAAIRALAAA